jgi:hypothetical protein
MCFGIRRYMLRILEKMLAVRKLQTLQTLRHTLHTTQYTSVVQYHVQYHVPCLRGSSS